MNDKELMKFVASQLPMLPHIGVALEQFAERLAKCEEAAKAQTEAAKPAAAPEGAKANV